MKVIPAVIIKVPDGNGGLMDALSPATPIEDVVDRLFSVCDGTNYTVYEPGDTLPAQPE